MSRDDMFSDALRAAAAASERRDELVRVALTTGDELDDIRRAKIWTRVEDRLDEPVHTPWRWLLAGGAGALALAAAVMLVVTHRRSAPDGFVAPPDATLSLRLGHARAALVGPARLDVVETTERTTTVALRSGRLLAEFEGGEGRSLRIEAPGATIEIVGTLFAVDVHDAVTCVSVSHGRVRMMTFSRVLFVDGGHTACSDSPATHALASDVGEALAHHAATLALAEAAPVRDAPGPGRPRPTSPAASDPVPAPVPAPAPVPGPGPRAGAGPRTSSATASASWSRSRSASVSVSGPASGSGSASASGPVSASVSEPVSASAPAASTVFGDPPPAPTPQPNIVKPTPPPSTATELYRAAEAALARRDLAAADRALATIIDTLPTSSLLDQALYDRARIAYDRHAFSDAQHHLDRLATLPTSPLLEPGAFLSCRIAIAANDPRADACLATYRSTYPHSPHDLDVLGLLVERAFHAGGCTRAAPLVDELARLYQATTLARGWRTRCP
ncbi:MAG: FecR domain-containing protein [Deltaproteobacteria bacterium]